MKKGFTLIELLAVILILGVILTISIYSVNSILNDSEDSLSDVQKNTILESAKIYYLKEGVDLENEDGYTGTLCVSINYLAQKGYLDKKEVKDLKTYDSIGGYVKIKNQKEADVFTDAYEYEYQVDNSNCSVIVE